MPAMPFTSVKRFGLAAVMLLLGACGRGGEAPPEADAVLRSAQVNAARIVLPPPGAPMAAGYFELHNPGTSALVLESLESPGFDAVEMHETVTEKGFSRMRPLANATVAPGETLRFEPGGMHLMLMGTRLPDDAGAPASVSMKLRLRAAAGGEVREIDAPFAIERSGQAPSEDPHAHHHH
jgi:periplasmic copper chaperone A